MIGSKQRPGWAAMAAMTWGLFACSAGEAGPLVGSPSSHDAPEVLAEAANGRLEVHDGLRLLRVWGTPEQRGAAHGTLLAADICASMKEEFASRFEGQGALLEQARTALPRLIEYPDAIGRELDALWQSLAASGVDLGMPKLGRPFDKADLLVANALDVFGLMGCSSFTVWGEQAVGGGVLTARNFDWPLTGDHLLEHTLLIVEEHEDGRATASVAWPGYVGTVSGISKDGVAAYLHVGSARFAMPEPSSWPSAIACRQILASGVAGSPAQSFAKAKELLEFTSPPVGFLTHVVLPHAPEGERPVALFETDAGSCEVGGELAGPFVVTNHFRSRKDGRSSSNDSERREQLLQKGINGCIEVGDRRVDVDEAWRMLQSVEVGGRHGFGTLHSLVFRHEPWYFELRVAEHPEAGMVAACSSSRRHVLTREQLFGAK